MGVTHHLAAPIKTPARVLDYDENLTPPQWETLFALLDAVVPSIAQCLEAYESTKKDMVHPPSYDKFQEYLEARLVDNPQFVRMVKRVISTQPRDSLKRLAGALDLMATRLGSLVATGYMLPVAEQPVRVREAIFQSWNRAWTSTWPKLAKALSTIARLCFAQSDPLLFEISGYREYDEDYRPGPGFDYVFMQFDPASGSTTEDPVIVDTDVVIVGSGCGGAVCAKVLAEAGHRVIVVEKGYHFPPSHLPMSTETGFEYLYENRGGMMTTSGTMSVLAGRCWGGGGTVNWSVSLAPQGFVRQEWADAGLEFFTTQEFQNTVDRVCDFMGVGDTRIQHNHGSQVILDGARKLGWHAKVCPQNTGGTSHSCGLCSFGCGSTQKKGPAVSWLPAAAKAGAQFIEGMDVSEILFDEGSGKAKKAVGVVGTWTSRDQEGGVHTAGSERVKRRVKIMAKKVVVSSGTLNSPLLLMRSGLKSPHIGKNLYLHPTSFVTATFDQDVKGWEGSILTSVCTSFENLDGKGHGVKLEPSSMLPFMMLHGHPWNNALQWKLDMLRYRQMNTYIALCRDRDTGRVFPDPHDGRPVVDYEPSPFDANHIHQGMMALAKLCYIEGATQIWPWIPDVPSFVRTKPPGSKQKQKQQQSPSHSTDGNRDEDEDEEMIDEGINDPDFVAWLNLIKKATLRPPRASYSCAHQMGTCRMSARPADGVVDPRGRVWEAEGLYIADASVFPSSSGVNPMITVMAIADWIARGVSRELKREGRA
ncbi:long-chain fatty alcohol dehydrogenase [Xylariomycetidae sp. FL2044]|nr:long-chain fatty alcohol dehydrogenase [Xylariomycetidae sp. FL2044]